VVDAGDQRHIFFDFVNTLFERLSLAHDVGLEVGAHVGTGVGSTSLNLVRKGLHVFFIVKAALGGCMNLLFHLFFGEGVVIIFSFMLNRRVDGRKLALSLGKDLRLVGNRRLVGLDIVVPQTFNGLLFGA